jgi:hypothetical protein
VRWLGGGAAAAALLYEILQSRARGG